MVALAAALPFRVAAGQETDRILGRMEFDRMRLYSGDERNVAALLQEALRRKRAMPPGGGILPMAMTDTRWRALGPDRISGGGIFTAGRMSAVAVHPTNMDIVYAGAAQGGVWRTDDAGRSWRPLTDRECSLAMGSIAIDPENPDIVYAGTGEQHFSGDSYYGCGVLRTLDGGETWEQQGADVFVDLGRGGGARISRVVIDRATAGSATSTTVLAASTFGLYRSTDSGRRWDRVLRGTATDLVVHPTDPSIMYAAVRGNPDLGREAGVHRSTDTGATWTSVSTGIDLDIALRINLAIAPSEPLTIYAAVETIQPRAQGLMMYRSTDGAATWRELPATGASCSYQCHYDMTIAVHPSNPLFVYFGAVRFYRSLDGGRNFAFHGGDGEAARADGIYVDQHLLVFDTLRGPHAMYLANDGGVYHTLNGGATWRSLATNLAVAQYYRGVSLHPSDPEIALGGTQDQGTQRSAPGTRVWEKVMGFDGGYTAFDAEDPSIWYGETQWIRAASYIGPRKNGSQATRGIDLTERGLFIPPLVMDPVDSKRLYFGVQSLYRTDDAAENWERIYRTTGPWEVITAIGLTPADANTVYAGVQRGRVVVTRDGGATWLESGTGLPDRFIGDVAVHPDDPDQAYAVAGGFLAGHVFQTVDGGATWRDRTGNLPDHPVNAVLYDPADPRGVFIGTDLGVFHSPGGGGAWHRLDEDLPTVAVFDLAAGPGTGRLVAATHGRGMFEIPMDVPLTARARPGAIVDTVGGDDTTRDGEVIVAPTGRDDHAVTWRAETDAPWVTLDAPAGSGRGRFQYRISGEGLEPGSHETTITVTFATLSEPLEIPVSLWVEPPLTIPPLRSTSDIGVAGWSVVSRDSLTVGYGAGADTAVWVVISRPPDWLVLEQTTGVVEDPVVWTRSARSLPPGIYEDTIRIGVVGHPDLSGLIADRFEVVGPMSVEDVALHYLGLELLGPRQVELLKRFGNGNDRFDLGDVLRWFDHCGSDDVPATGCRPDSVEPPRPSRDQ